MSETESNVARLERELSNCWGTEATNQKSAELARAIYEHTRPMKLPRAPLHTSSTKNKYFKTIRLNSFAMAQERARKAAEKPARRAKACPHCGGAL